MQGVRDYIKYIKRGFGRTSHLASIDIRNKRLSRSEGLKLVEKYDGKCSNNYIQDFCDYINISKEEFWDKVYTVTDKELFSISENYIKPKFKVGIGIE